MTHDHYDHFSPEDIRKVVGKNTILVIPEKMEKRAGGVSGTFTMDARKAAELINDIQPEIAIPVHYGTAVGKVSDGEEFAKRVEAPVKVVFKIEF